MARRLRIGVDIDGVIVDFISAFRQEAERVLGRRFLLPPGSWSFVNWNVTQEEVDRVWESIVATDNWFYLNSVTLPDVAETLPWLVDNHDVYFITARPETAGFSIQRQTQMYLDEIGIQFPTVLVLGEKGPIANALQLDAFVDDKIENLISVSAETMGHTRIFLMNQSHNQSYTMKTWTRVNGFKEFVTKIEELAQ